jgi:hypothetical protein
LALFFFFLQQFGFVWNLQLFLDASQDPDLVSTKKEEAEDFFADCITDGSGGFANSEVSARVTVDVEDVKTKKEQKSAKL